MNPFANQISKTMLALTMASTGVAVTAHAESVALYAGSYYGSSNPSLTEVVLTPRPGKSFTLRGHARYGSDLFPPVSAVIRQGSDGNYSGDGTVSFSYDNGAACSVPIQIRMSPSGTKRFYLEISLPTNVPHYYYRWGCETVFPVWYNDAAPYLLVPGTGSGNGLDDETPLG